MKYVAARRVRRKRNFNFDINSKRRREIIRYAIHIGAADTDDFDQVLIAWARHNRGAKDPVWSVMETARRMGGQITEARARAILEEVATMPKHSSADSMARFIGLKYATRQALRITTIGSVNVKKRTRKELRKRNDRLAKQRKRRALGMRPQSESLSATQPWRELGMSRAAWYRRNKARRDSETTLSTAYFLNSEDRPVSPEGGAGLAERGFASNPSSRTATTLATDIHATLPVELRLLALGLPMPENLARAA
jgi:hypothetical protein